MRRKDREITNPEQIFDILNRCDTINLAMNGGDGFPYVIPMTFACAMEEGKIIVYFHSALGGRKWDILNQDPRVCVEAHLYYKTVQVEGGITARYESVIGTGKAEKVEKREDKVAAFKLMLEHYKHSGFPAESCKGLPDCEVFRVVLEEVCGKHNMKQDA